MELQAKWSKKELLLIRCLMIFMIIQPFLDCRFWFTDPELEVFGLTVPTLVRCLGILILGLITVYKIEWERKLIVYMLYFCGVGVYFILHHMVASGSLALPSSYQYSLIGEMFYVVRMIFPFVIVFFMRKARMSYEKFIFCIQIVSLTIGMVIIVGNLFHISLTSYYTEAMYNKLNFIEWFTVGIEDYTFEELTSKGWFFMANQIGALMLLLLPVNLYDFLKRQTKLGILSTFSLAISMILLGTRVATYGCLGMIIIYIVMFLFFKIVRKEELEWKRMLLYLIMTVCVVALFWKSPINNRIYSYGEVDTENVETLPHDTTDDTDSEKYILDNYKDYKISDTYIFTIYPYDEDTEFWLDFMEEHKDEVLNNRQVQKLIVERIEELNGGSMNKLFGSSYTRFTSGGLYLEQDIIIHYYTIGILGILILLGPWLYYLLKCIYHVVKNMKYNFTFHNCTFLGAFVACVGCSVFSGHVMDELIITLFLGFIVGYFVINVESRMKNEQSEG